MQLLQQLEECLPVWFVPNLFRRFFALFLSLSHSLTRYKLLFFFVVSLSIYYQKLNTILHNIRIEGHPITLIRTHIYRFTHSSGTKRASERRNIHLLSYNLWPVPQLCVFINRTLEFVTISERACVHARMCVLINSSLLCSHNFRSNQI